MISSGSVSGWGAPSSKLNFGANCSAPAIHGSGATMLHPWTASSVSSYLGHLLA